MHIYARSLTFMICLTIFIRSLSKFRADIYSFAALYYGSHITKHGTFYGRLFREGILQRRTRVRSLAE